MPTAEANYKVADRFKDSVTYISTGGLGMRAIDLAIASQEDLKAVYEAGNTQIVEKIDGKPKG